MPSAELAPAPHNEMQEVSSERFPHFGIPGFEKLSSEKQNLYLRIPISRLDASRPIIEREIAKVSEASERKDHSTAKKSEGRSIETTADNRETQSKTAIDTFHRAEAGDPNAKKDLLDQKRELLGEEPSDDDIFQTMLEDQSGLFDNSLVLEVALSDSETQQHQDVLDLYKEFRGDLASVDEAISPEQQIDLFIEITKGNGSLPDRMFLARQSLTVLTANGSRNLSVGLKEFGVLGDGALLDAGVDKLRKLASNSQMTPKIG